MGPTAAIAGPIVAVASALRGAPETPVLMVDAAVVVDRFHALSSALSGVRLHYAVKANPAPQVLRTLQAIGCCWDVASPGEIDAVLVAGGDPADMSYGNTIKKSADIAYAFGIGVQQFTVDSFGELAKMTADAPGATVLVRLSTSGDGADWPLGRKFGCPEQQAADLLAAAADAGHPVGVSFHVGTQQRNPRAWDEPLSTIARLREGVRRRGQDLVVIDLGGGFPASHIGTTPPLPEYGAAIRASVDRHLGDDPPELIAEPGRALVADAGVLESEVVLVAERAGTRWVYLDAGLFSGLVEAYGETIRYRIEVWRSDSPLGGPTGGTVLAGPTCDSLDVLYEEHRYQLPLDLRPGDRVRFLSAGAYTASYSTVGFNGFAPLREVYR